MELILGEHFLGLQRGVLQPLLTLGVRGIGGGGGNIMVEGSKCRTRLSFGIFIKKKNRFLNGFFVSQKVMRNCPSFIFKSPVPAISCHTK